MATVPAVTDRSLTLKQWQRWENVGLDPSLDLQQLVLDWVDRGVSDLDVKGAIGALSLERTIEGASTLTMTLTDPRGQLFAAGRTAPRTRFMTAKARRAFERDPVAVDEGWDPILAPDVLGRGVEVTLDGVTFRLVKVSYTHSNRQLQLTFEDRLVYWLRRKKGSKRANRAHITRAQFILSLLREIKSAKGQYRFVCPELDVRQPVDQPAAAAATTGLAVTQQAATGSTGGGSSSAADDQAAGLAPGARVLGSDGRSANPAQRRVGSRVLAQADQDGATGKARLALIEACLVESNMLNLSYGDASSVGVLQLLSMHGSVASRRNVPHVVHLFLTQGFTGRGGAIALARQHPSWSAGNVAQAVQGSAFPGRYDQQYTNAASWLHAWGGDTGGTGIDVFGTAGQLGGSQWITKPYQYARNSDEDSWTAMQRLAEEVGWRCFVVGRSLYYMSEPALYRRRARYTLTADDPAVIELTYDVDWSKPVSEATLTVALERWGAPPGSVIVLDGWGPPDGRWLVASIRRDWFAATAEITLKQPGKAKLEPANEREQRVTNAVEATGGVRLTGVAAGAGASKAQQVYDAARAISAQNLPYVWGGGHARAGHPSGGGYDCSGSVVAALAAAGLGYRIGGPVDVSGTIAQNWGSYGRGQQLTVWANAQHVWIQFHGLGKWWRFDTSSYGSGGNGPHMRSTPRPTTGFTPRHWPGV